jgi:hypothetical protein
MFEDATNPDLEDLEEQAFVDEATTQKIAHEDRRDADAKQGEIERETREHHLDEG